MDISLKAFVSQDELDKKREIRQALWDQNRTEDQPLECPEEVYDPRTLYERLKEQKDKKEEEYQESKKFKHCIKSLDNDEVEFLEKVDGHKMREMKEKLSEEKAAIEEFQKHVSHLTEAEQQKKAAESKKSLFSRQPSQSEPSSSNQLSRTTTRRQAKLLQNAVVKRKASDKDSEEEGSSKRKKEESDNEADKSGETNEGGDKKKDETSNSEEVAQQSEAKSAFKVLGILPGLASYASDSSDGTENDSDNDDDTQINSVELDPFFVARKVKTILSQNRSMKKELKKRGNH